MLRTWNSKEGSHAVVRVVSINWISLASLGSEIGMSFPGLAERGQQLLVRSAGRRDRTIMTDAVQSKRDNALEFLDELDSKHDYLLTELDSLNARIDTILSDYAKSRRVVAGVAVDAGPAVPVTAVQVTAVQVTTKLVSAEQVAASGGVAAEVESASKSELEDASTGALPANFD